MVFATVIIVLVFVPLFALPGIDWRSLQKGEQAREIALEPSARVLAPLPDEVRRMLVTPF
mgnify:CR=1 FL=1